MSVIILKRLNENHDTQLPDELLNMTVGEMLDAVGELDTNGDADYEIIEDALKAISNKILGTGYEGDEVDFTPEGVEGADEEERIDSEESQIPTYNDITAGADGTDRGTSDTEIGNFEF